MPASRGRSLGVAAILFVQLLLGAWVAGLNAGYVSNTWPLMNDRLVPDGIDWSNGVGFALTHDPFLIHFLHRWWAWVVVAALVVFCPQGEADRPPRLDRHPCGIRLQILLGIATVETGMNIVMAALHQAVGASLVAAWSPGARTSMGERAHERRHGLRHLHLPRPGSDDRHDGRSRRSWPPASTSCSPAAPSIAGRAKCRSATETPALFKTTLDKADALIARIKELHSYDVPAIVVWPIERLPADFGDWVEENVR